MSRKLETTESKSWVERQLSRLPSKKTALKIGGAVASATLAAELAACGPSASASTPENTHSDATASASAVPGETDAPSESASPNNAETGPTVESLEIPADLPAEQLAQRTVDLQRDWLYAGATESSIAQTFADFVKFAQKNGASDDTEAIFAQEEAEKNAGPYATAFLGDWENDPVRTAIYNEMVNNNAEQIRAALRHYSNKEALASEVLTIVSVSEQTNIPSGERQLQFTMHSTITGGDNNGQEADGSRTYVYDVSGKTAVLVSDGPR